MKMTFDEYDELMEKYTNMNPPARAYGLTPADKESMETDPDRYIHFLMYLSCQLNPNDVFYNRSADTAQETIRWINAFLRTHLELVESPDVNSEMDSENNL